MYVYTPLTREASWYGGIAASSKDLSEKMPDGLLLMASGIQTAGGLVTVAIQVLEMVLDGLYDPSIESRVISKYLTNFVFASRVSLRL